MRQIEKMVLLQTLDHLWREHLVTLEHLRQVIGFRAYGQRDPLNEYKSEAFVLFEAMLASLREAATGQLMHVELAPPEQQPALQPVELPPMEAHHIDPIDRRWTSSPMADAALAAPTARGQRRRAEPRSARRCRPARPRLPSIPPIPATWGKVSRNAAVPVRLGQEVQALPRQARLSRPILRPQRPGSCRD